jgi:hypothetical protein
LKSPKKISNLNEQNTNKSQKINKTKIQSSLKFLKFGPCNLPACRLNASQAGLLFDACILLFE